MRLHFIQDLQCVCCNKVYPVSEELFTCPACGPAEGILDVRYRMERIAESLTTDALRDRPCRHWRYAELLPLDGDNLPGDWPIGWTPIVEAPRVAAEIGVARVRLKDEGRSVSGSFKDRASSVGVVHAMQHGRRCLACASTGNAASSLAACAAMAGVEANIFVSKIVPEAKLAQLLAYGARVFRVMGSYDDAYNLCTAACERFGWYNRSAAVNPYLVEGKKTGGLEAAEQCADDPPDWVSMSVGDGCSIAGVHKGLRQMAELGIVSWRAKMLGVQAEGVAPVARAFERGRLEAWTGGDTYADSINVAVPRNWRKAVHAVRESTGAYVTVSDAEIQAAMRLAARKGGVFGEPAGVTALAGVAKAVADGIIPRSASVLVMITGSGLKDVKGALAAVDSAVDVPPQIGEVARHVESAAEGHTGVEQ